MLLGTTEDEDFGAVDFPGLQIPRPDRAKLILEENFPVQAKAWIGGAIAMDEYSRRLPAATRFSFGRRPSTRATGIINQLVLSANLETTHLIWTNLTFSGSCTRAVKQNTVV